MKFCVERHPRARARRCESARLTLSCNGALAQSMMHSGYTPESSGVKLVHVTSASAGQYEAPAVISAALMKVTAAKLPTCTEALAVDPPLERSDVLLVRSCAVLWPTE